MQAEPGQLAVEPLAVGLAGEVAVVGAPVGDRAADAVDELADALFPLAGVHLAVEILVGDHVGGQLAPRGGHLAVFLLEEHFAPLALDRCRAADPTGRWQTDRRRRPGKTGRARAAPQ